MEEYNTACPRNWYSTCSFKVSVENNKIVKINPQFLNKSTPEGLCLKELAYIERQISEKRILFPLQNKDGKFVRISWGKNSINQEIQVLALTHSSDWTVF